MEFLDGFIKIESEKNQTKVNYAPQNWTEDNKLWNVIHSSFLHDANITKISKHETIEGVRI